jgi:hypothetical protein
LRLCLIVCGLFVAQFALTGTAQASACFWVGGTGTWNGTNTTSWASGTGGTPGTCGATSGPIPGIPGPSDAATLDGSSGGGTVTVNESVYTGCTSDICLLNFTTSAFTGTLDFNTNTQTAKISGGWTDAGTGTHTIICSSGLFQFTGGVGNLVIFSGSNTTWTCSGAQWEAINASLTGTRAFTFTGTSFGSLAISGSGSPSFLTEIVAASGTVLSALTTVTNCNAIQIAHAQTLTITTALALTSSSACPAFMISDNFTSQATLSIASGSTIAWTGFMGIKFAGNAISPTNSFDFGNNNFDGGTLSGPSFGSGSAGFISGGQ